MDNCRGDTSQQRGRSCAATRCNSKLRLALQGGGLLLRKKRGKERAGESAYLMRREENVRLLGTERDQQIWSGYLRREENVRLKGTERDRQI